MRILFDEQDVIDGCAVWLASEHRRRPEETEVDLLFDPIRGFSAEGKVGFRTVFMTEQDMIDGIALYLSQYHQFRPEELSIELSFKENEGVTAEIILGPPSSSRYNQRDDSRFGENGRFGPYGRR